MGFYETPVRRLRVIRACGSFVLAGAIAALPLFVSLDTLGRAFYFAAVTILTMAGAVYLWLSRRTPADATETFIPDRAPIPEQIRYLRIMLWLVALCFPFITLWIAYDLHQLETGAVKEVRIWAPLALLYELFGYWTAVLSVPSVALMCGVEIVIRLPKLIRQEST